MVVDTWHYELTSVDFIVKDSKAFWHEIVGLILNVFSSFLQIRWQSQQILVEDLLGLVDLITANVDKTTSRNGSWCDILEIVCL